MYAIWKGGAGNFIASVQNNPLYVDSGASAQNPIYTDK
jgi:hypothetical protein